LITLAIETSCDDTAVAILQGERNLLSSRVSSQEDIHALFGGIVPELAARAHLEMIYPMVKTSLNEAGIELDDVDVIGVTVKPGLVPSLLVGLSFAKAIAIAKNIPIIGVDHLEAHSFAIFLEREIEFPFISLVVSGGHTALFFIKDYGEMYLLGQTRDDAAGEAFDKVAKLLNLGYPGGPVIDKIAKKGDPFSFSFPRAKLSNSWDFSFSGIKTAVAQLVKGMSLNEKLVVDIVASFQQAVVDMLVEKTIAACCNFEVSKAVIAGGVAANSLLRREMAEAAKDKGIEVYFPSLSLCTDNAAMVAYVTYYRFLKGQIDDIELDVSSRSRYPKIEER